MRRTFLLAVLFCLAAAATASSRAAEAKKLNVLFIAVDDLRPALGCYGDKLAKTPNIDRLAAGGMVFNRAYCQQAVCAPSRNSLLTGLRPETLKIYSLGQFFRTTVPDAVTLPQHFKAHGYHTAQFGKIFHVYHGNQDDPASWSDPAPARAPATAPPAAAVNAGDVRRVANELFAQTAPPETPAAKARPADKPRGPIVGAPDVADGELTDGKIANNAIAKLRALKGQPFFLAVGFTKPHAPFIAPKKYWDQWERAAFPLPAHRTPPEGAPRYAHDGVGELRAFDNVPPDAVPDDQAREMIHGYYAATAYMDAQVGRVLGELDKLGLRENTVVVLWGDHGYQLGEHGQWAKHNNSELSTRAPLILRAPGRPNAGGKTDALTEFVDIYPSLCELAGLPVPTALEGTSFVPLLQNPERPWKKAAFSVWPKRGKNKGLGTAMRTERYRFVEWRENENPAFTEWELYDYQSDPGETANVANKPENAALVADLRKQLQAGWRAALPPQP